MKENWIKARDLQVQTWINSDQAISLNDLGGHVVFIIAFQMLCPGCVAYALPQATKVHKLFRNKGVVVIGLHTVFEHHAANSEEVLKAFVHENRIEFPVAIDKPSDDGSRYPETMKAYALDGTPTHILIDKNGYLRKQKIGHEDDLVLGAEIMSLIRE